MPPAGLRKRRERFGRAGGHAEDFPATAGLAPDREDDGGRHDPSTVADRQGGASIRSEPRVLVRSFSASKVGRLPMAE